LVVLKDYFEIETGELEDLKIIIITGRDYYWSNKQVKEGF